MADAVPAYPAMLAAKRADATRVFNAVDIIVPFPMRDGYQASQPNRV
jgi:hypothetical protein